MLKKCEELPEGLDCKFVLGIVEGRGMPPIIGIWELTPPEKWRNGG